MGVLEKILAEQKLACERNHRKIADSLGSASSKELSKYGAELRYMAAVGYSPAKKTLGELLDKKSTPRAPATTNVVRTHPVVHSNVPGVIYLPESELEKSREFGFKLGLEMSKKLFSSSYR